MESEISALSLYLPTLPTGTPLPDSVTLERRWQEAEEAFQEAQGAGLQMLVIFGGLEEAERCLTASAIMTEVRAEGANHTRICFQELWPVPSRPLVPSLLDEREEVLETGDLEAARLVSTPLFLLEEPKTFLLTWNPLKEVSMAQLKELRIQMMAGGLCSWSWTCRSVNKVTAGDRFLMLRQGPEPRGIIGSGWVRTNGWFSEEGVPCVNILWRRLVDPSRPLNPATIQGAEDVHWSPQGSGIELPEEFFEAVWQAWEAHSANDHAPSLPPPSGIEPTPVVTREMTTPREDAASSIEGRLIESWSSRRKRDPVNRARCLAVHGYRCVVCTMSFAEDYGEIGEGFIHIHHEQPLAASDDVTGSAQDPAVMMKPVCPNCHAMLHRGKDASNGEVRSIAEIKALRDRARQS